MADVPGKFYRATKVRTGVSPSSAGSIEGEPLPPVNPPGSSLNSVGLTMPSAFTVSNSPLTANGTIGVAGAGTVSQYIRGDGSLADFPESSGGGGSVSYYLNGSVNQGTIGGVAYKELNKVPILGAGTDFTINADGYIASFITDAGDPNLLEIPGGNWNFETYFSSSSSGGTPTFYVELYKYDGTTFTLIASSVTSPEFIAFGTTLTPYFSTLAVPTTTLALTDRLAVRYYVTHSGRTITLHTENNHLCQIITTFTTGLTALNGLTAQVQNFAVGTTGTDFNIASAVSTHTFNLPTASATNRGALSSADWALFTQAYNDKINSAAVIGTTTKTLTLTQQDGGTITASWSDLNTDAVLSVFGRTGNVVAANGDYTTAQVTESGNLYYTEARVNANANVAANTAARHNAVTLGTANGLSLSTQVLSLGLASAGVTGALSGTDWSTFNGKQNALTLTTTGTSGAATLIGATLNIPQYQTALTNPVTGTGNTNYLSKFTSNGSTIGNSQVFDNGTNVGIGTNNPNAQMSGTVGLSIVNGSNAALGLSNGTNNWLNYLVGTTYRIWNNTSTEVMVFHLNGNIGIGSSASDNGARLQVSGTATFSSTVTATSIIRSGGTSSQYLMADGSVSTLSNPVTGTGTTNVLPKFTGTSTIGNSAITDDGATVNIISRDLTITRGSYSGFSFGIDHQSTFAFGSTNGRRVAIIRDSTAADNGLQFGYDTVDKTGIIAGSATSAGAGIDFYTFNGSTWGNRIRVTAGGNLLVGTTTDNGARLQVSGGATFSGAYGTSSGVYLSGTTYGIYGANRGASSASAGMGYFSVGSQRWFTGIYENSDNFGIYSVGTAGFPLILNYSTGAATFSSSVTANGIMSLSDDGTYGSTYKTLGFTGNSNGSHRIFAGTADDMYFAAATARGFQFWTNGSTATRMTITSGGNVLIGTATDTGARLQVSGAATVSGDILVAGSFNPYTSTNRGNITLNGTSSNILAFTNNSTARGYIFHNGTDMEVQNVSSGTIRFFVASGEAFRVNSGRSILTYADLAVGGKINGFDLTTLAPTGTNFIEWRLGRALVATSVVTEDRWIRVQLGNRIYDILAIDRGLA
jgi:hypothetical protein